MSLSRPVANEIDLEHFSGMVLLTSIKKTLGHNTFWVKNTHRLILKFASSFRKRKVYHYVIHENAPVLYF